MNRKFQISGPKPDLDFRAQSITKYLYNVLKNSRTDEIIVVDTSTDREISRKDLLTEIESLAKNFKKIGLNKGDTAVIISENSFKFLTSMLTLFLLGVKVVCLNHDYTKNEIKHFFKLTSPKLVCSSRKVVPIIEKLRIEFDFVFVSFDNKEVAEINSTVHYCDLLSNDDLISFEPANVRDNEVILILSSSGTTGFPKGVEITYSNIRSYLEYLKHPLFLDFNENEIILNHLPFFHIFGYLINLASIMFGSKLVLMDKFKPQTFLEIIQNEKITKLLTVPPILLFLAKHPLVNNYDLSSIEDILCGAAPAKKEIEEIIQQRLKIDRVRQLYGMTETALITIVPKNERKLGSVGKVAIGFVIKVSDVETGASLGPNEIGEIRIKSDGIMKGYCQNQAETENSFDEDKFFKTGDLGYYDEDDYFYIVDRIKEIIKYKGFQVPPAELENILINHPNIKDAGVIGIPDERAGEKPLAFIVKEANSSLTEEEIIQYVADNISIQKQLHGGVRFIKEIPKSPSGKILRRKLKELL